MAGVASATKEEVDDAMGDHDQWSNLVLSREAFQMRAGGSVEVSQAKREGILVTVGAYQIPPNLIGIYYDHKFPVSGVQTRHHRMACLYTGVWGLSWKT